MRSVQDAEKPNLNNLYQSDSAGYLFLNHVKYINKIQPTLFVIKPFSSVLVSTVVCQFTPSIAFIIFPLTLTRKPKLSFKHNTFRPSFPQEYNFSPAPLLTLHLPSPFDYTTAHEPLQYLASKEPLLMCKYLLLTFPTSHTTFKT